MNGIWLEIALVRRTLFLCANSALAFILVVLFIVPIFELYAARDVEIARQVEVLARLRAIADRSQFVHDTARQRSREAGNIEFLMGPNDGVAVASLQARLKIVSESSGTRIRSIQSSPSKTHGGLRYIGARIEITGTLPSIHRTVHAIESARPYLSITNGAIRLSRESDPRRVTEPVLEAQFEVSGALKIGGRD
jgi:general secretion pathway protein M